MSNGKVGNHKTSKKDTGQFQKVPDYSTGIKWKDYKDIAKLFAEELAKVINNNENRVANESPKN